MQNPLANITEANSFFIEETKYIKVTNGRNRQVCLIDSSFFKKIIDCSKNIFSKKHTKENVEKEIMDILGLKSYEKILSNEHVCDLTFECDKCVHDGINCVNCFNCIFFNSDNKEPLLKIEANQNIISFLYSDYGVKGPSWCERKLTFSKSGAIIGYLNYFFTFKEDERKSEYKEIRNELY